MSATAATSNGKKPVIVKEQTFELAADGETWLPTGKYTYVLYEDRSKQRVLTYRNKWADILAAAKQAASFN